MPSSTGTKKIETPAVVRRTGGRTARTTQKVLDAVSTLLGTTPLEQITMGMVAQTAGVNEVTLYRKWGKKDALLADALLKISDTKLPVVDTGNFEEDLFRVLDSISTYLQTPEGLALLKLGTQAEYPMVQQLKDSFWGDRFAKIETLVRAAEARGELERWEDGLAAYEMGVGLLHFRVLERGEALTEAELKQSLEILVKGIAPAKKLKG